MSEDMGWDREMEKKDVKGLSPAVRSRRALLSFERKVAVLERWGRQGVPPGAEVRRDRAKLRRWLDPLEGLWPWDDPAFDHPRSRNAHLHTRFLLAIELIDSVSAKARRPSPGRVAEAALVKANHELVLQNARLLDEVIRLRKAAAYGRGRAQ